MISGIVESARNAIACVAVAAPGEARTLSGVRTAVVRIVEVKRILEQLCIVIAAVGCIDSHIRR